MSPAGRRHHDLSRGALREQTHHPPRYGASGGEDGLAEFRAGPHYLPGVRHTAMWVEGDILYLLYTLVGEQDVPERIYLAAVDLSEDWRQWRVSSPKVLLDPEERWEGADLPFQPTGYGAAKGRVRQLCDSAVYEENGRRYLLYSVAGEQGIAIAELETGD